MIVGGVWRCVVLCGAVWRCVAVGRGSGDGIGRHLESRGRSCGMHIHATVDGKIARTTVTKWQWLQTS
jgi:hypothetical protein